MNLKHEFTDPECKRFRQDCNFTDEELAVFNLRVKGLSVVEIEQRLKSGSFPMSESTINRRLKSIKRKIHKVL